MKLGKRLILFLLLAVILLGSVFPVSAEETDWAMVDWANVDWDQIYWEEIDWRTVDVSSMLREMYHYMSEQEDFSKFDDLCDWLENNDELYPLFLALGGAEDPMLQSLTGAMHRRFAVDPYGMIRAIAREDEETQAFIIGLVSSGISNPEEFNQFLAGIQLPDNARDAEWDVWKALLREAPEIDWTDTDWSQIDWSKVNTYKVDWNQVDWEKTDVKAMFRRMLTYAFIDSYNGFTAWFYDEAELQEVLYIARGTDGATTEACSSVLYDHFVRDSYAVIQAIAREEDEQWRNMLASFVVYGADYPFDELSQILGSQVLPETATDAERAVWAEILSEAERQWDVVPTGDAIAIPAVLLLASCCGLALLIGKKSRLAQ